MPSCEVNLSFGVLPLIRKLTSLLAMFNQDILNAHCYHIVFGCSGDNGYAPVLRPHTGFENITLLEGRPFAHELAELASRFFSTSFPDVFRSTQLPRRRVSFTTTPPRTPTENYAAVARNAPLTLPSSSSIPSGSMAGPSPNDVRSRSQSNVAVNAQGQRVDLPLHISNINVGALKKEKYCNMYHILGRCGYVNCEYKHGTQLTGQNLQTLRHIARLSPCPIGLECRDETCISGHRCTKNFSCTDMNCWFGDMHRIDTTPV
jgi:hypothetical protein